MWWLMWLVIAPGDGCDGGGWAAAGWLTFDGVLVVPLSRSGHLG